LRIKRGRGVSLKETHRPCTKTHIFLALVLVLSSHTKTLASIEWRLAFGPIQKICNSPLRGGGEALSRNSLASFLAANRLLSTIYAVPKTNEVTGALLSRGYFPKELPPCFNTKAFAAWADTQDKPAPLPKTVPTYHPVTHSLSRAGSIRRMLAVPHPDAFRRLAWEIGESWEGAEGINAFIEGARFSQSRPVFSATAHRALPPKNRLRELTRLRITNRRRARYALICDVSEFYRSLYTHSIPWALHTKKVAKANRKPSLLGNRLDSALRLGQDQQTNGIPVGPDSSHVIAELVLAAVEKVLPTEWRGHRYYDDYEFAFRDRGEAEAAIKIMQEALSHYSLHLNPLKTRVVELPEALEKPWLLEFREFNFRSGKRNSKQRIIRFFDRAFEHHAEHPGSNVMAYALRRVAVETWHHKDEWELVQDLLMQAVTVEMSATQQFVSGIIKANHRGEDVDTVAVGDTLNQIITLNAQAGNASEAVWALFGILVLELKVDAVAGRSLQAATDVFVSLLALDALAQSRIEGGLDLTQWNDLFDPHELYGDRWLLTYECARQGWTAANPEQVKADSYFKPMFDAGVSFFERVGLGGLDPDQMMNELDAQSDEAYGADDADGETDDDASYEPPEHDSDEE
jgi:hypothetical protein